MSANQPPQVVGAATQGLLAAAFDDGMRSSPDALAAANATCARLGKTMALWVGVDGWHALLRRAVADVAGARGMASLDVDADGRLGWHRHPVTDDARALFIEVLVTAVLVLDRFIGSELTDTLVAKALANDGAGLEDGS